MMVLIPVSGCVGVGEPWVVEDAAGNLVEDDPRTGRWWSRDEAQAYVDVKAGEGAKFWAYPRTAIGLVI